SDYGVSAFGSPGVASNYQLWGRANPTSNFTVIATTSVTVSGNRVIFTLPSGNITTTWYYTIGTTDNFNSPLPIELLSFTATPLDNKVNIAWATSSETNNNYFTVERSGDGTDFAELTRVPSKASNGTSTVPLSYQATDPDPLNGTSYYRLKQTDNNGIYNRFNVVSVNFASEKNILFSVFPNPNAGAFTINFSGIENNKEVQIVIHDAMGRMVYSRLFHSASINDNQIHIAPANGLAKGIYECSLTAEGIRRKLVVIVN
ncbi:MAG TPA: T9SS type A sorting domain-containing protein, partial [Bacteroidia bacterium]|nr:T9SS type A sorting domain-containing protein [Bacteroidia bacterium]